MSRTIPINDVTQLGRTLRRLRREQNLTQEQLARKAHVSRTFLIELEDGHPRAELAKVLEVFAALGANPLLRTPEAPAPASAGAGVPQGRAALLADVLTDWQQGRKLPDAATQQIVRQYVAGTLSIDQALAELDALPRP